MSSVPAIRGEVTWLAADAQPVVAAQHVVHSQRLPRAGRPGSLIVDVLAIRGGESPLILENLDPRLPPSRRAQPTLIRGGPDVGPRGSELVSEGFQLVEDQVEAEVELGPEVVAVLQDVVDGERMEGREVLGELLVDHALSNLGHSVA